MTTFGASGGTHAGSRTSGGTLESAATGTSTAGDPADRENAVSSSGRERAGGFGDTLGALDVLGEKVDLAHSTIVKLREDNDELRAQCESLRGALARYEGSGTPDEIAQRNDEIERLGRERDTLLEERAEVVARVRSILDKVQALEESS